MTLRKQLCEFGVDAGPDTIHTHLVAAHGGQPPCSVSSIWRMLKRRGFIVPEPHKRPKSSFALRSIAAQRVLADGRHPRDIAQRPRHRGPEHHRRLLPALRRQPRLLGRNRRRRRRNLPRRRKPTRLSCIGAQRQRRDLHRIVPRRSRRPGDRTRRARHHLQTLPALPPPNLRQGRTVPPNRQEISHRNTSARSITELQTLLGTFRSYYNDIRPHRANNRHHTNNRLHRTRTKPDPPARPVRNAGEFRIRYDRVDQTGKITLRYAGKLRHLAIGRAHKGRHILMLVNDRDVRVISSEGEAIATIHIDPDKLYQPRNT